MKELGIRLSDPAEKFIDDLSKEFYKVAYLDRPPQERARIAYLCGLADPDQKKTGGFLSGVGNFVKGMTIDPAVNAAKGYGQFFDYIGSGDYGMARRSLLGAAMNTGITALNFTGAGGLARWGVGAGVRGASSLARAAALARQAAGGLARRGATSAAAEGGQLSGLLGRTAAKSVVGKVTPPVSTGLAKAAPIGPKPFFKTLPGKATSFVGYTGMYGTGHLLRPDSDIAQGTAVLGLQDPNNPKSLVNSSALGLSNGSGS